MDPKEREALLAEAVEKAKAALILEAKADMEKINKLIFDQRVEHDKVLEGKKSLSEFKIYEEKSLETEKETRKRVEKIETKMNRPQLEVPGEKVTEIKVGQNEYKASFLNFMRSGRLVLEDTASEYIKERKALVSDTTGQILIPVELEAEIFRTLPKLNIIRGLATQRNTTRAKIRRRSLTEVKMGWGKLELGGTPAETDVVPSEDFQHVEDLEGLARIGKDELQDSDVSLEAIVVDSFGRARAETEETGFVIGTGHSNQQPDGMLNGTTVTRVITAAVDAIAADDLLNLIYAVPAQYRRQAKLLVPSSTELAMRKLKTTTEEFYLWQPNVQAGQPSTFAGYPVLSQEDIPAIGSSGGCDIAIFGDIKAGYRVVDRAGMTIQRILELWTLSGLVGILVSSRVTGGVIRADALRVLQELP